MPMFRFWNILDSCCAYPTHIPVCAREVGCISIFKERLNIFVMKTFLNKMKNNHTVIFILKLLVMVLPNLITFLIILYSIRHGYAKLS